MLLGYNGVIIVCICGQDSVRGADPVMIRLFSSNLKPNAENRLNKRRFEKEEILHKEQAIEKGAKQLMSVNRSEDKMP